MNLRYLLDTNIISEPLKAAPSNSVMNRLNECDGDFAICSPVWHEMIYGMERLPPSHRKKMIKDYLERVIEPSIPILPYDSPAAEIHARLRAESEAKGQPLPFVDSQISAIALAHDMILVTRNIRDFRIFDDLKIEDWFS